MKPYSFAVILNEQSPLFAWASGGVVGQGPHRGLQRLDRNLPVSDQFRKIILWFKLESLSNLKDRVAFHIDT